MFSAAKNRWIVASASAALAIPVAAAALAARHGGGESSTSYRGSSPPGNNRLPEFRLRNHVGTIVDTRATRDRVVVLTLLDAQCRESCPAIAWTLARTVDELTPAERRQVRIVGVSVDPAEDTRAAVEKFLRDRRATGRFDYVVGSEAELRPVWKRMQILPSLDSGSDDLHSAPVRVYDRRHLWVSTLHAGADLTTENLLHDIRAALRTKDSR